MPITAATAGEIIRGAMKKIRALGVGESPSAEDSEDCLTSLNDMLDTWSTEGLMIFASTTDQFNMTPGKRDYTIGASGEVDTIRPESIPQGLSYITDATGFDWPLVVITEEAYNSLTQKNLPGRPHFVFYDPTYPLGKLYFYYVPDTTYIANIVTLKAFTAFPDIYTDVLFPPSYVEAMKFNLAVRIAPDYGKQVSQDVLGFANSFKTAIKSRNFAAAPMVSNVNDLPAGIDGRVFNIYANE